MPTSVSLRSVRRHSLKILFVTEYVTSGILHNECHPVL